MLIIIFLVTDCSVLYSLSMTAQYSIPCHWLLSIIFLVTECSVLYSLSLTAQYYFPCHWLLSIIFLVTICSVLYSLSLNAQYSITCHWLLCFILLVTCCPCNRLLNFKFLVPDFLCLLFLVTDCPILNYFDTDWYVSFPCHHWTKLFRLLPTSSHVLQIFCCSDRQCDRRRLYFIER